MAFPLYAFSIQKLYIQKLNLVKRDLVLQFFPLFFTDGRIANSMAVYHSQLSAVALVPNALSDKTAEFHWESNGGREYQSLIG